MWSLLKAAALLGAVAAVLYLLPVGGRTLADRWRKADGVADFAARTWAEARGSPAVEKAPPRRPAARGQTRAGERARRRCPRRGSPSPSARRSSGCSATTWPTPPSADPGRSGPLKTAVPSDGSLLPSTGPAR